jgi:hypothetical protein
MIYRVKIRYWDGWEEDYVWLHRTVTLSEPDYVTALKIAMEEANLDDEDIEEIEITEDIV